MIELNRAVRFVSDYQSPNLRTYRAGQIAQLTPAEAAEVIGIGIAVDPRDHRALAQMERRARDGAYEYHLSDNRSRRLSNVL